MAAFQFPNPNDTQTVVNPITGSTYQWKEPPGKWVVTTKLRGVSDIIYEGDNPPNPIGDYKLWYSTDTLELYFHYCDVNGVCAWLPTSAPITMLEDLDAGLAEVKADVVAINQATITNENKIETFIAFSATEPPAYPDAITPVVDSDGNPLLDENGEQVVTYTPDPANHKFWLKTDTNELHILRLQDETLRTYAYELVTAGAEIWFSDEPPTLDSYEFWFETVRLELLIKFQDQWWPVSLPASQLEDLRKTLEKELQGVFEETARIENEAFQGIRDLKYSLDLEQVLENGAIADQGIILRSPNALESDADAIILAPTISRITLSAEQKENFIPTFQLVEKGSTSDQNRTAEFELDDGRLDINMTEQLDEVHFRFRDEEELVLRHRSNPAGPSELYGKLKVDPGQSGNEVVTYEQLEEVAGVVGEIQDNKEKGSWKVESPEVSHDMDDEPTIPEVGDFYMEVYDDRSEELDKCRDQYFECAGEANNDPAKLAECNRQADACRAANEPGYYSTLDFAIATRLVFNKTDSGSIIHSFADAKVGDSIRVTDRETGHFLIAEVEEITDRDEHVRFLIKNLSHSGFAVEGKACEIAFYKFSDDFVDLSAYVKKTGDEMAGTLHLNADGRQLTQADSNKDTVTSLNLSGSDKSIFKVESGKEFVLKAHGKEVLHVQPDEKLKLQHLTDVDETTADHAAATKKYVDSMISPAKYAWEFYAPMKDQNPSPGTCHYDEPDIRNTGVFRFHPLPKVGAKFEELASGERVMYKRSTGNIGVYLSVWYWLENVGEWRFKGSGPVQEIIQYPSHIKVKLYTADCISNGTIASLATYHVTISGFF